MSVRFTSSPRDDRVGFAELADQVEQGLTELEDFGVPTDRPEANRFSVYLGHIRWMDRRLKSELITERPPRSRYLDGTL